MRDRSPVWPRVLCFFLTGWLLLRCDSIVNAQSAAGTQGSAVASPVTLKEPSASDAIPRSSDLALRVEAIERTLETQADKIERLDPLGDFNKSVLAFAIAITAALSILGAKPWIIDKAVEKATAEVAVRITDHFNRVDPTGIPVHVHSGLFGPEESFKQDLVYQVVRQLGLEPRPFHSLNELKTKVGCVVYGFKPEKNGPEASGTPSKGSPTSPDQAPFVEFLKELGRQRADTMGFVIYSPYPIQVSDDVPSAFPIITYANTVVTIGTNVLTIARCLAPNIRDRGSVTAIR